jgi:hypothetical protein
MKGREECEDGTDVDCLYCAGYFSENRVDGTKVCRGHTLFVQTMYDMKHISTY